VTPEKLEKIRRLAADERGDPATRAIAQAALRRYAGEDAQPKRTSAWRDPRHPGLKTSAEYDRYRFMDLGTWKKTANGNPTHAIVHAGKLWRIILFRHKKGTSWGWMRIDTINDKKEFSGRFSTLGEAHEAAWESLMAISPF
jgi:hypothetical protein